MTEMKIEQINEDRIDDVIDLFVECFENDHYYKEIFSDTIDIKSDLRNNFTNAIRFCVTQEGCYGSYKDGSLLAYVLYFDYFRTKRKYNNMFLNIFNAQNEVYIPYKTTLHDCIESIG